MRFFTPSLLILGAFIIGGVIFKATAPTSCNGIMANDSVFVLTGDARRIPFAMHQMNQYPNTNLYIIGAGAEYVPTNIRHVSVESDSKSTYQNALAIKKIATESNLHRIVLVTTVDHINRAMRLVRDELPNVIVIACPVQLHGMPAPKRLERWATEYVKYIVTLLGIKES